MKALWNRDERPVRVLVVDDSPHVRALLTEILNEAQGIVVVGSAGDPYAARGRIKELNPDVLTLDIEMPGMNGLSFLKNLMRLHPLPVVMVSSLLYEGAEAAVAALELGAVDCIGKPRAATREELRRYSQELVGKVRMAADAKLPIARGARSRVRPATPAVRYRGFVAIGASTGGVEAIRALLEELPENAPPILITQHIPAVFSRSFAERMDRMSALTVSEARDGEEVRDGHAYIAPGDRHLAVAVAAGRHICRVYSGRAVNRHRPSVDVLFHSIARHVGPDAIGVLLTGMGEDGARGLKAMRDAGALTLVQDEATSVVWGMPRTAWERGAAGYVLPLHEIAPVLLHGRHLVQERAPQLGRSSG